jgi:hypothetical protein
MNDSAKHAFFLIADISGYTRFLAETEINHAKGILESLFEALIPAVRTPLTISGLQGDALFAYAIDCDLVTKQCVLDLAEKIYCAFAESKERIGINSSCRCDACTTVNNLDLKIVIHHGEFVTQRSGDHEELTGKDVTTAFRLLKNDVRQKTGVSAYALITRAAVNRMELQSYFAETAFITEHYEHIGDVELVVHGLERAWQKTRNARRIRVDETADQLIPEHSVIVPLAVDSAFVLLSRPDLRVKWIDADKLDLDTGASSRIEEGTQYHCHHGKEVFSFEIIDWQPGEYLTVSYKLPMGLSIIETDEIIPVGEGSMLKVRLSMIQGGTLAGKLMKPVVERKLRKMFSWRVPENMARLASIGENLSVEEQKDAGLAVAEAAAA